MSWFAFEKKHRAYTIFFEKFARTFAVFPVTRVRNPTAIAQKNLFNYFGWLSVRVIFLPVIHWPLNYESLKLSKMLPLIIDEPSTDLSSLSHVNLQVAPFGTAPPPSMHLKSRDHNHLSNKLAPIIASKMLASPMPSFNSWQQLPSLPPETKLLQKKHL